MVQKATEDRKEQKETTVTRGQKEREVAQETLVLRVPSVSLVSKVNQV